MQKDLFIPKTACVLKSEEIVARVRGKFVLNIGMGGFIDDSTKTQQTIGEGLERSLHAQIAAVVPDFVGLDINPTMIQAISKVVPGHYVTADITDPRVPELVPGPFETVIFGDVLEHLDSFRAALRNIASVMAPDGEVIIVVPNAYCFDRMLKMLLRYESVHTEHTCYFSYFTMKRLLAMNDFEITDFRFCNNDQRTNFSSVLDRFVFFFTKIVLKAFPQFAQGIIFQAKLRQAA